MAMENPGDLGNTKNLKHEYAISFIPASTDVPTTADNYEEEQNSNVGPIRRRRWNRRNNSNPHDNIDNDWCRIENALHCNIGFLLKCGVPPKYVYPLSNELLDLMTPEGCGICRVAFANFNECRSHYCSKYNQRKHNSFWVPKSNNSADNEMEAYGITRERYCELCDITITSKAHGLSHYLGRAHMAVVTGEKGPKNKALFTFDRRINQLRNWEDYYIKKVKEEPSSSKQQQKSSHELYCRVCGVKVSTMVQMVQHRNGKKHLANEMKTIFTSLEKPSEVKNLNAIIDEPESPLCAQDY